MRRSVVFLAIAVSIGLIACGGGGGDNDPGLPSNVLVVNHASIASTPDGLSWETAFSHPQHAMETATSGFQVWVAGGTYTSLDTNDPTVPVLTMKDDVQVYGGFAGTETQLLDRDLESNPAILDGESIVYQVVIGANNGKLDGFEITGSNATNDSGGGMRNVDVQNLVVENCSFISNHTDFLGGGIYNEESSPTINNCIFIGNTSLAGAGIHNLVNSSPTILNSVFLENVASGGGGAIHNGDNDPANGGCDAIIVNCLIAGNSANNGGGITSSNSSPIIINNTITDNNGGSAGGGLYNHASTPEVRNTILYGNIPSQIHSMMGSITDIQYSNIQGGWAGTGNIDSDPLFVDSPNDNYRLQSTSPSIDAGDNTAVTLTYDLDGNDRILDGPDVGTTATVDMGAYEHVMP